MILRVIKACTLFYVWAFFCYAQVIPPADFQEAKKILLQVYREHPYTFYCDCEFDVSGRVIEVSALLPANTPSDMLRLEWEHIVPASLLGKGMSCWDKYNCPVKAQSNRKCCQKTSSEFREKEANLYNLVPSIKLANRMRSNYRPGIVSNKETARRVCHILIDKKKRVFEPADHLKGFIARTYLKMEGFYSIQLSDKDRLLFQHWDMLYPKETWEKRREEIINSIYGINQTKETKL